MNRCRMCGTSIPGGATECPNCHFKISSEKRINTITKGFKGIYIGVAFFSIIIVILTVSMFIKFNDMKEKANDLNKNSKPNINNNENPKEQYIENLELQSDTKITHPSFYYIEGTLKNNNNIDLKAVQITFAVYDEKGVILGTHYDIIDLIEANGLTRFKIYAGSVEPSTFKLKEVKILG